MGQILLLYIANTSRTHRHCRRTGYRYSVAPNHDGPLRWRQCRSLAIEINTGAGGPVSPRFWVFLAYKKILGRTETRTRDRMYNQSIRTVWDISRDDRAKIATCSLRTSTYRHKENYSIDMVTLTKGAVICHCHPLILLTISLSVGSRVICMSNIFPVEIVDIKRS